MVLQLGLGTTLTLLTYASSENVQFGVFDYGGFKKGLSQVTPPSPFVMANEGIQQARRNGDHICSAQKICTNERNTVNNFSYKTFCWQTWEVSTKLVVFYKSYSQTKLCTYCKNGLHKPHRSSISQIVGNLWSLPSSKKVIQTQNDQFTQMKVRNDKRNKGGEFRFYQGPLITYIISRETLKKATTKEQEAKKQEKPKRTLST